MTMYFIDAQTLLKKIVLKNDDFTTIIHIDSQKEMTKSEILKMKLTDIQNMGNFAIC